MVEDVGHVKPPPSKLKEPRPEIVRAPDPVCVMPETNVRLPNSAHVVDANAGVLATPVKFTLPVRTTSIVMVLLAAVTEFTSKIQVS